MPCSSFFFFWQKESTLFLSICLCPHMGKFLFHLNTFTLQQLWAELRAQRKAIWLKAAAWFSMPQTFSNVPNYTKHMLFHAAWMARSCCNQTFSCTALCPGLVSLFLCRARRYDSCSNSAPQVPFWSKSAHLVWIKPLIFFIFCQHTFCFVCPVAFSLPEIELLSRYWQLSRQHLASGVFVPPVILLSVWEQSSSSASDNAGQPQTCSTPTNLPKAPPFSLSPSP